MTIPGAGRRCELPAGRDGWLQQARTAFNQNRFAHALAAYDRLLGDGEPAEIHAHERWICAMKLGKFERAWRETDDTEALRISRGERQNHLPLHLRRVWNGSSITNRRVLVRCYHGLGDTIQFIRYIPLLSEVAAAVTVELQPALVPLLGSFRRFAKIVSAIEPLNATDFDLELELMELPYAFRTWLDSIPAKIPYVQVSSDICYLHWLELTRLGLRSDTFNVGLVWSSGNWNPQRNVSIEDLSALGQSSGVRFFGLQRDFLAGELIGTNGFRAVATERETGTVLDTAATILNLDLVISVDTMVAHLAGALGKNVWTLLPYCCDWRWMADRDDSPWYPTMRLFRQEHPGEWRHVIDRAKNDLRTIAAARSRTAQWSASPPHANCGSSWDFSASP